MTEAREPVARWGRRAASLYDRQYARRYRDRDDQLLREAAYQQLIEWLRSVGASFGRPIDALDLGCGTGRYFWALTGVRSLVGLDVSAAMLAEARHPIQHEAITAGAVWLVQADLLTCEFEPRSFDLVYSIGVVGEHVPFDDSLVARVVRWLRPGGRFAFTTVHPESPSLHRTLRRRLATLVLPVLAGAPARALHARLMAGGLYGDERWVRGRLGAAFVIETLERFASDVHLHARCVARRVDA